MTGAAAPPSVPELDWPYGAILAIGPLPPPQHGVATCMKYIVSLRERGVPLRVVDTADRRGIGNIGRLDLVNVWLGVKHAVQAAWSMMRHRPAVVFLFLSQNALAFLRDLLFMLAAVATGRTLVIQLAGGYFREFYEGAAPPLRALIRWALRRTDRVLVLGESLRPMFAGLVPPERIGVLPNAVDTEAISPRGSGAPAAAPIVAFMAQVSREKGALDLLHAMPAILRAVPDARVRIAGEIPDAGTREEIERAIADHDLAASVELAGVVSGAEKTRFLAEAAVFAFPTRYPYEGHPYVVLEAMASGLPLVTTDQGCITETVRDGENGVIVRQGDVPGIAAAVVALLRDPSARAAMGRANRHRIESTYDVRVWRKDLLAELRVAHESRRGRAA